MDIMQHAIENKLTRIFYMKNIGLNPYKAYANLAKILQTSGSGFTTFTLFPEDFRYRRLFTYDVTKTLKDNIESLEVKDLSSAGLYSLYSKLPETAIVATNFSDSNNRASILWDFSKNVYDNLKTQLETDGLGHMYDTLLEEFSYKEPNFLEDPNKDLTPW